MHADKPKPRMPLWGKILLTLSLVLNLAFVGLAGGLIARAGGAITPLGAAIWALPDADRQALRHENRAASQDARRLHDTAPTQTMIATLRAPEFDAEGFASALEMARSRANAAGERTAAQLLARVKRMTHEERLDYARELQNRLERRSSGVRWRPLR